MAKEIDEHSSWGSSVVIFTNSIWAIGTGKKLRHRSKCKRCTENPQLVGGECQRGRCESDKNSIRRPVNASNCADLAKLSDIDGFLVGGASLNGDDFAAIATQVAFTIKQSGANK